MSSNRVDLNDDVGHIIECMISMGYLSDVNGICWGLGMLAAQAIIAEAISADQIKTFNERIALIKSLSKDVFNKKSVDETFAKLIEKARNDKDFKRMSLLQSIKPFFDSIDIHHTPDFYTRVFPKDAIPTFQDPACTLPLLSPVILDKWGGIVQSNIFSTILDYKTLTNFFKTLGEMLVGLPNELKTSIAFSISIDDHVLVAGFHPIKKTWYLFNGACELNANNLPINMAIDTLQDGALTSETMAYSVFSKLGLNPKNPTTSLAISCGFFVPNVFENEFKTRINQCLTVNNFNVVTSEMAKRIDSMGSNLLCIAAANKDIEKVKLLSEADPFYKIEDKTAFTYALENQFHDIAKLIKSYQNNSMLATRADAIARLSKQPDKESNRLLNKFDGIAEKLLRLTILDYDGNPSAQEIRELIFNTYAKIGLMPAQDVFDAFKSRVVDFTQGNFNPTLFAPNSVQRNLIKIINEVQKMELMQDFRPRLAMH